MPRSSKGVLDPSHSLIPDSMLGDLFSMWAGVKVPDPITFIVGEEWLNRPNLYPRQATLIKVVFLREDLFTDYDYQVVEEWEEEYRLSNGTKGLIPGVLIKMRFLRRMGHKWFREVLLVMGRRAGKGHVTALCMTYVLWNYMALGDPQAYYGVDRDKQLVALIFAGKRDQAKATVFGDLVNVISGAPCFVPFVNQILSEKISIYAPNDFKRIAEIAKRGVRVDRDQATFIIQPRESTMMAGRGPTSYAQCYDEAAHIVASGANRAAEEIYCLEENTKVHLADGTQVLIGEVQVGDEVLAVDEDQPGYVFSTRVVNRWEFEVEESFEIELDDGRLITCSGNHCWFTQRGWVRTDNLMESDEILEVDLL